MFKYRICKQKLIQIILLISIIIEVNLFYVFPLPSLFWLGNNDDNKTYIIIIIYIAIILMLIFSNKIIKLNTYNSFIWKYLIFQIIISVMLVMRSKNLYSQSLFDMLMCADYLMVPIMVIPYMYVIKNKDDFDKFLYLIFKIVFIVQIIIFLQGVIYLLTGSIIFRGMSENGLPRMRGNSIRSTWSAFNFIGICYAFNCLINSTKSLTSKKQLKCMIIITLLNLILFCNTRVIIITTLFTLLSMYILNKNILFSNKIFLLILVFFSLVFTGALESIISSFSINGRYAGSTSVRIHEVKYYLNEFIKNPLFGLGLLRPIRADLKLIYGGVFGGTPTDVGILGLAAETGILGIIMFGILLFRGIYIIKKLENKNNNKLLLIGLLIYIIGTLPTLIITNISRILALPLCMAIFESVYYNSKVRKH